jgi:DNA-binding CsgD family transcriptional regulator
MIADIRRKELALGRIKRLASSGLALEPFVHSVFELINDAVPNSPNRSFHAGVKRSDAFIFSNVETERIINPLHDRFYVEAPPEISGVRFRMNIPTVRQLSCSKVTWKHEEITLPNFHRTEGFNTVFRPAGYHHFLLALFQEGGEFVGYYPIWHGADQKPFNAQDVAFVQAAAPHIAHGLKATQFLGRQRADHKGFVPGAGWGSGIILMDNAGRLIAMDTEARLIFQQLGVLDSTGPIRNALDYITSTLRSIFHAPEINALSAGAPVSRLYVHWTGIVLRLRGVLLIGADGREYINVLVERGETAESRRRRLIVRWGLSLREAEILWMIGEGRTGPEIAILLCISHDTVRKHTSRILEKLGVETRTAAAAIALSAAPLEFVDPN